jgi:hypothetical protein
MKRLGRLAWLSVNAVVELTEQKRMLGDPEYGEAVARLRLRQCIPDDVELFNSRVMQVDGTGNGVSLQPEESVQATTIVRDNRTRLYLNAIKAQALIPEKDLILCAARDFRENKEPLEGEDRETHLKADFSSTVANGGLPSFIPLSVGMEVVLRNRNISAELKIANGSTGVVKALFTSPNGPYVSADGAIVHFPGSTVRLPNLPPGCIHLEPESTTYSTVSRGVKTSFRRRQLIIEPKFAVTGHFSQGKTLRVVVADLKNGGPAAYVAASRPTARGCLFLLKKITLRDLNHPPLPPALLKENARLEIMKHNTLVEHGFLIADKRALPDEVHEESERSANVKLEWDLVPEASRKRKGDAEIPPKRPTSVPPSKKRPSLATRNAPVSLRQRENRRHSQYDRYTRMGSHSCAGMVQTIPVPTTLSLPRCTRLGSRCLPFSVNA